MVNERLITDSLELTRSTINSYDAPLRTCGLFGFGRQWRPGGDQTEYQPNQVAASIQKRAIISMKSNGTASPD